MLHVFQKIFTGTLMALFLVGATSSQAAECFNRMDLIECYVDTPGYDNWSESFCTGIISSNSTTASFRLTEVGKSLFGDSGAPEFVGWAPNCTTTINDITSICNKTIVQHQMLVMSMVAIKDGETCTVSATAVAFGNF